MQGAYKVAIVALIIGIIIGVVVAPVLPPIVPVGLVGEVKIGILLPLTGELATFGENNKEAALIAEAEVNEYLRTAGAPWHIKLYIEDTAVEPALALEKLKSLHARGIKFVVGLMASSEVRHCKEYFDANQILVTSPSSTAPDLEVAGDFLYRLCPNDLIQGPALARIMYDDGVRYVVPIHRADPWGYGLEKATRERFEALGGVFVEPDKRIAYTPKLPEYTSEVELLAARVSELVEAYGAEKVGVLLISFEDDAILILRAATAHPVLATVRWYGTDGTALSGKLEADPDVAAFMAELPRPLPNTIFAPTTSDKFIKLRDAIKEKLGRVPEAYAYCSYDAVWIYALCLASVGKYDSEAVRKIFPTVAASYFGASGRPVLSPGGDRAFADYDIWAITKPDLKWKLVGLYKYPEDVLTWY